MSDNTSRFGRLKAWLAPSQDGDASPQARDEQPIAISREEHTQEPARDDIERWTREYYQNPLIRQAHRNFASDVLEPGVAVTVDTDDGDEPTVSGDYPLEAYQGLPLSEALELWLGQCGIVGGRFDRSFGDVLEDVLLDKRGRRGTALVEHAYDDPEQRQYILGVRTFKPETTTAYTRDGKSILLRPDDTDVDFETVAIQDITGDPERFDEAPLTPAGKAAAFVQYDDIFGRYEEKDDIPFALDDVTLLANDPDTGAIFGQPDTASVVDRSEALREMFDDTQQAVKSVGYGHWIAQVDTDDEDTAKQLLDGFDPSTPEQTNVVNYAVDVEEIDGTIPDNVDHIQQLIEYILTGLPTPLYRVGFAGDINRDVTSVQQDDYQEAIQRERDRLESAFHDLLHQKAREFIFNDAKADQELDADVALAIEPEDAESPLLDEAFDAEEFSQTMQALKAAAPGGAVEQVVPPHEVRETFLGLDPEPPDSPGDADQPMALPDETDQRVQAAFQDAYLGNRYRAGDDMVETPDGVGLVVEALTSSREIDEGEGLPDEIDASTNSPTYVVTVPEEDPPIGFYKASDLQMADLDPDVDPLGSLAEDEEAAAALADAGCPDCEAQLGDWSPPESWRQSDVPARVIALDAFASMGGDFDGCKREMRGEVGRPANFCGAFMDYVFGGYDYWRGDSFLPGD